MRNLNHQLKQLCQRNCDGSFATQADRERILYLVANQLAEMGFRQMSPDSLRPKHVEALVARWKSEAIGTGTIKNRMSALRWWAEKVGKENVVARNNGAYAIENRVLVTNRSKAKTVGATCMALVTDVYTAMSLRLQSAFGLRREESIKIIPSWADQRDRLRLKDSWTKGGRYREVPIFTAEQRAAVDAAKDLAQGASLIPAAMLYRDQLQRFRAQCDKAGIGGVHGLRHQYAQSRYEALTGWKCPAAGGPSSKQLTASQKARDREARLTISAEMGHGREQITAVYLGR
jgi:site-specific recombinase XerC